MSDLTLNNVNKIYPGGIQAVFDFNIEIEHGEFIVLLGPSGCGKSTILRMIAGLEEITSGDMILAGERINDVAPADRDISMVFQNYALYGHMSVYQNIGFSQIIRHEDAEVMHEKIMEAAEIVELKNQLNRYPRNLSGGQRQRVALGRSIVNYARVILMDEPLSNLDAKLRVAARRELTLLHEKLGNTFVYVTHDQTEAMTMADRIVVMDNGRAQQIGTPREVYHYPENIFVGGFIGSPPMNFITGHMEEAMFVAPGVTLPVPERLLPRLLPYTGKDVVLGIRAEHFSMTPSPAHSAVCAEILKSEYLGNHSLVALKIGDYTYTASLKEFVDPLEGNKVDVYIDTNQIHFFDAETTQRIKAEEL